MPALPSAWEQGSYKGLVARGNFEVSVQWKNGKAIHIAIQSNKGGECRLVYNSIGTAEIRDDNGQVIQPTSTSSHQISFMTECGRTYRIEGIQTKEITQALRKLKVSAENLLLTWDQEEGVVYNLYRVTNHEACYECIAKGIKANSFEDTLDFEDYDQVTYKLTATREGQLESIGITQTINHATPLQMDRYKVNIRI